MTTYLVYILIKLLLDLIEKHQGIKENFNQIERYVSGYRLEKKHTGNSSFLIKIMVRVK